MDEAADEQTIEEFNAIPDDEGPPPVIFDLPVPEELRELAEEFPFDMSRGGPPGKHPLWGAWMGHRRRVTGRRGGKPPKPPTADDIVKEALRADANGEPDQQVPDRPDFSAQKLATPYRAKAVAKLVKQLRSNDERIAQTAALKLLEMSDGKPGQQYLERDEGPRVIEYQTVALTSRAPFVPAALSTATGDA